MSESEHEKRNWSMYVRDMIEFSEKVLSYTAGLSQDAFTSDSLTYDASLRNIELIGEAATHIPAQVRHAYSDIPWREVIGARNRVAHGSLDIDNDVVWDIIQADIPDLLPKLRRMLEPTATE